MNLNHRWFGLAVFFSAAAICYFLGFSTGAVLLITLGAVFEIAFWIRLFRRHTSR